jgi:DNA-binding winged helix-turn-helix (wHTH) protein/pimeloyl-ACP methyl ester carboxylesterase
VARVQILPTPVRRRFAIAFIFRCDILYLAERAGFCFGKGRFCMFVFAHMVLDGERRELRSGSQQTAIEPQVFDLLEFLIRNRDRVVSRDDLLAAVWHGRIVSDSAIAARVNAARRAIGDSGEEQRWIRTLARKGFRFVGDVREEPGSGPLSAPAGAALQQAPHQAGRDQEITFCRTKDGVNLAVACVGQGMPVVRTGHWMTHVQYDWQSPIRTPLLHFLADRYRLIRYDSRNNGLSDWDVEDVSLEALLNDLETVVDAVGVHSYALLGVSQGASISIAHAVRHPERVSKLILHGGYALGHNKRGPRKGFDVKGYLNLMREGWGDEHSAFQKILSTVYLPNAPAEHIKWMADLQRVASSPENTVRLRSMFDEIDVVHLLHKVSVPTLVMHCRYDNLVPFEEGRRLATLIPNAKFVELESENHVPQSFEPAWPKFVGEIEAFLSD